MPINWGNSNVKDIYWGSTPVKEVWYGSNKIWSRVATYYNKTISVDASSTAINDNISVPSGNYEFTIKISEYNFIKFNLSISSALTLNIQTRYRTRDSFGYDYFYKEFYLKNASEDNQRVIYFDVMKKVRSSIGTSYDQNADINTAYYTVSILNDSISPRDAFNASAYEILLQNV